MKSIKTRIAMAAAVLAATGAMAANDVKPQAADSTQVAQVSQRAARPESKQFEFFENQVSILSVPSYSPSEHPDAKPAPRSRHSTPSVFDDTVNTASPG